MKPETPTKNTKLCPTCGTRLSEDASRCLVCGTDFASADKPSKPTQAVQGSRIPAITLSLPFILGFSLLFLAIGAGLVYYFLRQTPAEVVVPPTQTPTLTFTATVTITPTPVTPIPTDTPIPTPTPFSYRVAAGDNCSSIAFAFGVSIQSIVLLNDLPAACDTLFEGQNLLIPQPTPTATQLPTATLSEAEATRAACGEIDYVVQDNDTLSSISANYAISITALKNYNGLVSDNVRSGQSLKIPLCERAATPGPSPTPTPPPPYPAPNLLLPQDGIRFLNSDNVVALQWAAVGTLRENEAYAVTIVDFTDGADVRLVDYVTDTKFIVPQSMRPGESSPHVFRWWVLPVRQAGTDDSGNPIWEAAGNPSAQRVFVWAGITTASTPSP
ncbi:MAG: LysM peptidoglycan-binding domain-containing protein [Anaerolineales bacterium]|nr:MAG: LysM peptidoglycan-binding domain-containing protein [Anaerolineales bacterium]